MTTSGTVRRAVIVGVDAYTSKPLDGCVADATMMATLLQDRFGFERANVSLLLNEKARKATVLAELDQLVDLTEANDVAFIFYAGHGSQSVKSDGTEASGFDSTFMVSDAPREDILDDDIGARLAALGEKTPHTVMIVDACNSGTLSRSADLGVKERWAPPADAPTPPAPTVGVTTRSSSTATYTLISACRDDEIAKESAIPGDDSVHHGALTFALVGELQRATSGATWRDVFERAARIVLSTQPDQHPQIEGNADRDIFGLRELPPTPFVEVTDRASTTAVIAAGSLQGVSVGARYTVYASGTKDTTGAAALGTLEVLLVKGTTSRARVVSETTDGAVAVGTRAFAANVGSVEEMLATENTDPKTQLKGAVTLELWKLAGDTWQIAESDATAGMPVYSSDDRIAFSITSTVDTPLFVNLFDVDAQNTVTAFTKGDANRLAGNGTFEIGKADGRRIRMPHDGPDAIEHFKLFASVSEVHLQYLTQLDSRARAPEELKAISADDWTAVTRRITLRKAPTTAT